MTNIAVKIVKRRQVDKNLIVIGDLESSARAASGLDLFGIELLAPPRGRAAR